MYVGFLGEEGQGGVVVHIVVVEETAVPVAGVFAEAYVGEDDDVLAKLRLDGLYGTGDEGIVGVGGTAPLVLLLVGNHAEEEHLVDAEVLDFLDVLQEGVDAEAVDAGHGGDFLLLVITLHHEVGVDEVCGTQ